jgi:hypothetical protein
LRQARVDVELVDHSALDGVERQQRLDALLRQQLELGFDLAQPPLMRLVLVRTAPRLHRLVWTHHHIVLDGWSLSLVLDEVLKSHAALRAARAPALEAPVPYRRVLDWLAAEDIAPAEPFWRQFLAGYTGAPELRLPAPAQRTAAFAQRDLELEAAASQAVMARAQRAGVTLTTVMQAAWACVLGALTASEDVVFGVVTSGRELAVPRIDAIVGLLVTTLPLRVQLTAAEGPALDGWLRELQQRAATLREHEAVPLAQIARWCDVPAGRALFDTLFVMSNYPEPQAGNAPALGVVPDGFRTVPAYPASLIVVPGQRLLLRLVHDQGRLDGSTAMRLLQALAETLAGLAMRDELAAPTGLRDSLGHAPVAAA